MPKPNASAAKAQAGKFVRQVSRVPNGLTIARIVMIPFLIAAILAGSAFWQWVALALFILASVTDWLDGYLARRWDAKTNLGRMLDPIADKLLIAVTLVVLIADNAITGIHVWAALAILVREFFVSGLREFLGSKEVTVHVTQMAKWKTTLQMIALGTLIAAPALMSEPDHAMTLLVGNITLWLAAALTVWTGWDYFRAAAPHLKG